MKKLRKTVKKILLQPHKYFEEKRTSRFASIYDLFREYTMIPKKTYSNNLELIEKFRHVEGSVVECGTWRGGMIGGIAKLFSDNKHYHLFDSFEGLPEAQEIDGVSAKQWQSNTGSDNYYDNCKAEMSFAEAAMKLSGVKNYFIHKGWFNETLPSFNKEEKIAVLRLDGDWYKSTKECLENLYDHVVPGGVIVLDDYYAWDGCTRALHDFLSERKLSDRIRQWKDDNICYIIKEGVIYSGE